MNTRGIRARLRIAEPEISKLNSWVVVPGQHDIPETLMVRNEPKLQKYLGNLGTPINVIYVAETGFWDIERLVGRHRRVVGRQNREARERLSKLGVKDPMKAVNLIVITGKFDPDDFAMPPTPWIVVHRLMHAAIRLREHKGGGVLGYKDWPPIFQEFIDYLGTVYGFKHIGGAMMNFDWDEIARQLFSFKSARKSMLLDEVAEFHYEILTHLIVSNFKPKIQIPNVLRGAYEARTGGAEEFPRVVSEAEAKSLFKKWSKSAEGTIKERVRKLAGRLVSGI